MKKLLSFKEAFKIAEEFSLNDTINKLARKEDKILDGDYLEQENYFLFFPRTDLVKVTPPTNEEFLAYKKKHNLTYGGLLDLGIHTVIVDRRNKQISTTWDFRSGTEEQKTRMLNIFYKQLK